MNREKIYIGNIPAIIWGEPSDSVYIHVHGKCSAKEYAEDFARIAEAKGHQTLSFDLPAHGQRGCVCSLSMPEECNIFTGMRDLKEVGEYADTKWSRQSLFACSLGAYFALCTYADRKFERVLFQSPIVDMVELTRTVFERYGITEEQLLEKKRISTPIDMLDRDYYRWIITHPIERWTPPTAILYAAHDDLQTRAAMEAFCTRFGAKLTVSDPSYHPFAEIGDEPIVREWLENNIH